MTLEDKAVKSISRAGFIGFVIMLIFTFLMEFVAVEDLGLPKTAKFILYILFYMFVLVFGVNRPDLKLFMTSVKDALSDGKITANEALGIIRNAFFFLLGLWANTSEVVAAKEKQEKIEPL